MRMIINQKKNSPPRCTYLHICQSTAPQLPWLKAGRSGKNLSDMVNHKNNNNDLIADRENEGSPKLFVFASPASMKSLQEPNQFSIALLLPRLPVNPPLSSIHNRGQTTETDICRFTNPSDEILLVFLKPHIHQTASFIRNLVSAMKYGGATH